MLIFFIILYRHKQQIMELGSNWRHNKEAVEVDMNHELEP